jgi:hypothetical protein
MLENIRSSGILNYREAMEIISFLPSQQKRNDIFPLRLLRLRGENINTYYFSEQVQKNYEFYLQNY